MDVLEPNIFSPGTKFEVTDDVKDSAFGAGSTGFISYIQNGDQDYQNVIHMNVIIIRRGKGGMARLNHNTISAPAFFDKRMLDHEGFIPIDRKYFVNIKRIESKSNDLFKLEGVEFLGWITAYAKYLSYICNNLAKRRQNLWPADTGHPLVVAYRMVDYYSNDDKEAVIDAYTHEDFKESIIINLRSLESKISRCVLKYRRIIAGLALNSAKFLDYTNEGYYEISDKKITKDTIKDISKKAKSLREMEGFRLKS